MDTPPSHPKQLTWQTVCNVVALKTGKKNCRRKLVVGHISLLSLTYFLYESGPAPTMTNHIFSLRCKAGISNKITRCQPIRQLRWSANRDSVTAWWGHAVWQCQRARSLVSIYVQNWLHRVHSGRDRPVEINPMFFTHPHDEDNSQKPWVVDRQAMCFSFSKRRRVTCAHDFFCWILIFRRLRVVQNIVFLLIQVHFAPQFRLKRYTLLFDDMVLFRLPGAYTQILSKFMRKCLSIGVL